MQTKKLPNGLELPVLGIGTCLMGGEDYGPPDYSDDGKYVKAIQDAIKLGYTHIDTAEIYGGGHTEELVGKAIKDIDRNRLIITAKVSREHLKYDDVIASAKNSLKRLGTDYIDIYLIHRPNQNVPLKETMKAINDLVDKKLVRFIGVSAFNTEQMKEAQKYSKHPIVANQLKYNLWAKIDIATINYCQENNIMAIAYKPFGRGKLTEEKIELEPLSKISKKYNKTKAQIILNWLINKRNVVVLFKSTNTKHLKENKEIFDFRLTKDESTKIDSLVHM